MALAFKGVQLVGCLGNAPQFFWCVVPRDSGSENLSLLLDLSQGVLGGLDWTGVGGLGGQNPVPRKQLQDWNLDPSCVVDSKCWRLHKR